MMNRQAMLEALSSPLDPQTGKPWDVLVIGGGATGLGTALDAASRGYRTVLLEAADFAKGTSSRSTKLIHGGVRYLRQGQVQMVRESLIERGRLQHNAPHIVHPRQFVIPSYHFAGRYYYYAGMKAYDLLAGKLGYDASQLLSTRQTLEQLPTLRDSGLRGGVLYSDGQFDDARLAIALAQTFVHSGGIAVNYAPVVELLESSTKIAGVVARDAESGREFEVRAKAVVNATGVFGESIMKLDQSYAATQDAAPEIVASQGSHVVLSRDFLPSRCAMLIPDTDDGRVLFAIPWHDRTLLGTTDHQVDEIALEPRPLASEIDYLLDHAGRYLTKRPERSDILSVFSGLRPLVGKSRSGNQPTSKLSREHEIVSSPSGLITVIGGKWTTYRKMGEDVIDLAARVAGLAAKTSQTAKLKLYGAPATAGNRGELRAGEEDDALAVYGSERQRLLQMAESEVSGSTRLDARLPYITAQVRWAVEHEMARTVDDVLARRTRALLLDAQASLACAETTATIMQRLLDQNEDWKQQQLRDFRQLASGYQLPS